MANRNVDQNISFEFVEGFEWAKLEKCAPDEHVFGRQFIVRHGLFYFKWRLGAVTPTDENERKGDFGSGLTLRAIDALSGKLSTDYGLYADTGLDGLTEFCVTYKDEYESTESFVDGPSVASLRDRVVDGVVELGVNIFLKASDFDPLKWLPLPSLTPRTGHVVRQLFDNLGTDNHRNTDFVIVVGEGDAKTELHVNSVALSIVPFFDRIFADAESKENKESVLQLPTHTVDAVREALRYIYLNEIGEDLTRFLPSILSLASKWELKPLLMAIERDMVIKLLANHCNFHLAADLLHLADKYDRRVVSRVAICILMDTWQQFLLSGKDRDMAERLIDQVSCAMAARACRRFGNITTPLTHLSAPSPSLTPNDGVGALLFANLGTDDHRSTDFIITVGPAKAELHVSSLALSIVPFFDRMFGNDAWKENQQGVLHLPTHTVEAVIEVLRFVYLNEVGDDLTRFLPSVLSLASEWELTDLMMHVECDMINKLKADRFHSDYELAADYLELADRYGGKVLRRFVTNTLIVNWPQFIRSPKGKKMNQKLKDMVTIKMAKIVNAGEVEG